MLRPATTPPRLLTLILLTSVSVLSLNMFLPSLAHIAEDLQAEYSVVSLAIAGYLAITAVLQIVIGPLSDWFGRRPVLLAAIWIYAVASAGCALSQDVWTFLCFRVLQGAVIAGTTLSAAIIRDTTEPSEAASRLGYVGMAMAVAPMVGPMVGGVLDQVLGWRAIFVLYTGLGAAALCLIWVDVGETRKERTASFGAQLRAYGDLVKSRRFWGYVLCMTFGIGAFYAFLAGAPLVAAVVFGMSPAMLGLCLGSITAGFSFGSFLSGRYASRIGLTGMMIIGRTVAAVGLGVGLILLGLGVLHPVTFFGATICAGIGNGLTTPSANAGAMSVRPQLAGSAAGLSGAMIIGSGAVMTSAVGAALTEANAAAMLLSFMFAAALAGLAAASYVRRIDRLEGPLAT